MIETRTSRRRGIAAAFAAAHLLTFSAAACGNDDVAGPARRGRGPLVAAYDAITACDTAVYRGPETPLYSDRPYRTAEPVTSAVGFEFCRGARHGTQVWLLEAAHATRLLAFANADSGLEARGWTRLDSALRVDAAGVAFDTVYSRRIAAGRHVIRQGFTASAPIVLWDPASARSAPSDQRPEAPRDR